jgi:hypothetical protein
MTYRSTRTGVLNDISERTFQLVRATRANYAAALPGSVPYLGDHGLMAVMSVQNCLLAG